MPYVVMELDANGHTNFVGSFDDYVEADDFCRDEMNKPRFLQLVNETSGDMEKVENTCPPDYMWIVEVKSFHSSV